MTGERESLRRGEAVKRYILDHHSEILARFDDCSPSNDSGRAHIHVQCQECGRALRRRPDHTCGRANEAAILRRRSFVAEEIAAICAPSVARSTPVDPPGARRDLRKARDNCLPAALARVRHPYQREIASRSLAMTALGTRRHGRRFKARRLPSCLSLRGAAFRDEAISPSAGNPRRDELRGWHA